MPALITGIVFNDLNHNGQFNPSEPGIANVFVDLYSNTSATCLTTQTDANGNYSFSVSVAGTYTVYEPVANPGVTCPPTIFTQPSGFTVSNGPRKLTVTVTQTQINNNATISNINFSHDTTNNPLFCSTTMIQFTGRPSVWYNINIVTGTATAQGTVSPALEINAIAYNPLDNYIYGYDQLTNHIVRVDSSGNVTVLSPLPPGMPVDGYNTGTFDLNGFYYVFVNDNSRFYVVDLRPNSPTYLKLVNPANGFQEQTSNFGVALSRALNVSDWVYRSQDNNLYGITPTGVVQRISPTSGVITNITTTPQNTGPFGAVAIDATGTIYAISNSNGNIYRYTIAGNTATALRFSTTVTSSFNDATLCPLATISLDYGDAPDTSAGNGPNNYSTTLASDGPRHQLLSGLVLGTQVTSETDAYQNPTATGDDLIQGVQDDGLSVPLPTLPVNATNYSLHVTVTNQSGSSANLYGWVDFNRNGIFQGNEAAPVQVVPSQAGTQVVTLNFVVPTGAGLTPDHTFVRLRFTTDILVNQNASPTAEDTRSLGPASDGEVEDYLLQIDAVADLQVVKGSNLPQVLPGQELIYTIDITNNGPNDAQDVTLTDAIPAELQNPEYSLNGGATYQAWDGSVDLGTLPAGGNLLVLIRGTVGKSASGIITNTAVVSSSTPDPDPSNNSSTVNTPVVASADLSVIKIGSPSPVLSGELLTYTIVVSNAGPSDAANVSLTDVVPSELLNSEFSSDGGVTYNPWVSPYSIGTVTSGDTVTILLRGTVSPAAVGTITNTASVDSTTEDPDPTNNTSTEVTPVITSADISVDKQGSPVPVPAGGVLTYSIVVANAGPSDAADVTLADAIPSELTNAEFSIDGGLTYTPWPGSYNIGILNNGTSMTILIRGTVNPSATGTITNTAVVSSTTPDPDPTNNVSTEITPVNTSADLSITKTGSPDPVPAGSVLTYTLLVVNAGPNTAQNVTVTDAVPSELSGVQYSLDGGVTFNPWTGSINIGALANGSTASILVSGTVDPLATDVITNTATVDSTTPDPDPTNNTSTVIIAVNTSADISVVKTASPDPVSAGDQLTYTIVVANAGPNNALAVMLTDAVPSELTGAEFSVDGGATYNPWTGTYNLSTLIAGASTTVLIRGTVSSSASGSITNTATVDSTTPDEDPTNNTSTVITPINASADISIVKTASPDPVTVGGVLTYTLVISNAGPSDAEEVMIIDAVPSDLANEEVSIDGGITFNPWVNPYNLGALASGATVTLLIRGTVSASDEGSITNTAVVTSTTPDPDPTNNTSTTTTNVSVSADVSIVKTESPNPALPDELLTYTIVLSNAGPSDAQNVTVTDAVSSVLSNVEFSVDGGTTYHPWGGSYNIGTLASGLVSTIYIRGLVNPTASGVITNTATVTSTTPDPDPSNNTSTINTPITPLADMAVVKVGSPNPVLPGELLTYTIVVSNAGPSAAEQVIVTDVVPNSLTQVQYSLNGGITYVPWTGSVNLGTLSNSSSATILLRGIVSPSVTGSITNTVSVTSTTPDPDPSDNTSTTVTLVDASADISVEKTGALSPIPGGQQLTYTVSVSNAGPSNALSVMLQDIVPSELTNVQYSLDGGTTYNPWTGFINLGTIANGQTVTVLIRGSVNPSAAGTITNTAVVVSTTPDPDPTNNTSTERTLLAPQADLSVVKRSSPNPVLPGQVLTYTVTVTNAGPSEAQNVSVLDSVSGELTQVVFSVDGGLTYQPWPGVYRIGTLGPRATVTIIIKGRVRLSAKGSIRNTAIVDSTTPDPDPSNNMSSICTIIARVCRRCCSYQKSCKCSTCRKCSKCSKCCTCKRRSNSCTCTKKTTCTKHTKPVSSTKRAIKPTTSKKRK
ncbi:DUF7507 domain-containing protein [Paenibacillus roseipurpureus]|uniref:SdrD B-like domain-containing protein n=1 Tax=Paenibacillus roseopurpureus TaxID=2918901 RepID=A0AA96LMU0_9BACL|nr:SdrD B-like domain-containing protein [Paenibacillus sp. MBLB1832]WNR44897.1 SdrD B-like domain-containing protein [Paenibacillus sp. MBLB1832]